MASITININGGASVNPTSLVYPVNINGSFEDSMLSQNDVGTLLQTIDQPGFVIDQDNATSLFGRQNAINFAIDEGNAQIQINANDATLRINGTTITQVSAGGSAGLHLIVYINDIQYKIALLNP